MLTVSYIKKLANGTSQILVKGAISGAIKFNIAQPIDEDQYKKRLSICALCPEFTGTKCKKCGCFTDQKARLVNQKCPLGKWEIVK